MKTWKDPWEEGLVSLWKETLEHPFSIVRVVRRETLVGTGPAGLRKDNIVAGAFGDGIWYYIAEYREVIESIKI
jgi:hypothetical protein